jgi:hypothetical protein
MPTEYAIKQGAYNVTMECVRITPVAMETQKCVPFVLFTYVCRCQQCSTERVATEGQRSSCKARDISPSYPNFGFIDNFRKSPQYQISRKSVQW